MNRISIKKYLHDEIMKDSSFIIGNNISADIRENFSSLYSEFYNSKTYGEANSNSKSLLDFFLDFHEKNTVVGPCFEVLNKIETYKDIFKDQRLHTIHTINVFFLGLLLYSKNPIIKKQINDEIERTTFDRELQIKNYKLNWRYSGGSIFSEFLYRWRLCALPHDIGYPISLAGNKPNEIDSILKSIALVRFKNVSSLDSLLNDSNENLIDILDNSMSFINFKEYFNFQIANPLFNEIYYDHGIISSLLLFNLLRKEYSNHITNQVTYNGSTQIVWDRSFLNASILYSVRAIACHNLDQNILAYEKYKSVDNIYNIENEPLIWLLKVSDILQEWDKPKSQLKIDKEKISETKIQMEFNDDSITFSNFPQRDKLLQMIKNINSENIIKIK